MKQGDDADILDILNERDLFADVDDDNVIGAPECKAKLQTQEAPKQKVLTADILIARMLANKERAEKWTCCFCEHEFSDSEVAGWWRAKENKRKKPAIPICPECHNCGAIQGWNVDWSGRRQSFGKYVDELVVRREAERVERERQAKLRMIVQEQKEKEELEDEDDDNDIWDNDHEGDGAGGVGDEGGGGPGGSDGASGEVQTDASDTESGGNQGSLFGD